MAWGPREGLVLMWLGGLKRQLLCDRNQWELLLRKSSEGHVDNLGLRVVGLNGQLLDQRGLLSDAGCGGLNGKLQNLVLLRRDEL